MRSRSLRTRLVATVLLLLAVVSAVIAVVTTVTLQGFLRERLDQDVRAASRTAARVVTESGEPGRRPGPPRDFDVGPRQPEGVIAWIVDGRVVTAAVTTREGGQQALPAAEYPDLVALRADAPPVTADLGALGDYRVVASSTSTSGLVVAAGLSEERVQETVARLVTTELIVAVLALVGAGVAGAALVRRELAPLERVAGTAARVSALPLDRGEVSLVERVPDVDPRTEVGQVGSALNRMLDHVGAALAARHDSETRLRQFVADASHELRTPLAAIRGYAELTRREDLPAETTHSLSRISSQAERMTTLVEDLLLLARLDAGRPLERGDVDLTRLVLDAVSDAHAAGPEHRWELALPEEPVTVPGDSSRLAQVLANLLANARTHTPPGTLVTVSLTPNGADGVELTVADAGPGITPELLPHVFERFARGSASRSRQNGSTGLGLAIVHAVTVAHHGAVAVTSTPGDTRFTVRLPAC